MNISADKDLCTALIKQLQLPDDFHRVVSKIYLPLSEIIMQHQQGDNRSGQPLLVSINGVQGTGKSTMTAFLKHLIETEMKCHVANISLDDFYHVRAQRMSLSQKIHPLLITRGVPGTHDVGLIEQVLEQLLNHQPCRVPSFDKALDDRRDQSHWMSYPDPVEVILFEGWCNNSPPQDASELVKPVNALERVEDPQGIWRHYVNEQLQEYRQRVFSHADLCIMLKAADFECVYDWRGLQEQKLKAASDGHEPLADKHRKIMNETELVRFIQHFERISRHTLSHLPAIADVVLPVDRFHSITAIELKLD